MADQVLWTGADGTVIDLTDASAGYMVLGEGTRGLRSPEYALTTQAFAGSDGELITALRATGAQPTLGLLVAADDENTFRSRARALRRSMRPKAGLGTLTVRSSDGEARSLDCLCTAGLEGDEASAQQGSWWKLALKFYAPDPWWYGDPVTVTYGLGTPAAFFPIFPLVLSPSTVIGQFVIDLSDSDAPSYPVWTITGPGNGLVLTNLTTSQVITVNAPLSAGEQMVVDTRPGLQSVRKADGTNLLGALASDPALWSLVEDSNAISVALTGATSASVVAVTYTPRYAGI